MEQPKLMNLVSFFATIVIVALMVVFYVRYGSTYQKYSQNEESCIDLPQIKERRRLDVSMNYNSLNYFILHGKPNGFQYELSRNFADFLGVEIHVSVINDLNTAIKALKQGQIDIICSDIMPVKGEYGKHIEFSTPYAYIGQVLVQNKNNPKHKLVKTIDDLSGKTIFIPRGSQLKIILSSAVAHLPRPPFIIEVPEYSSEQLIDAVAEQKISFTIADSHLAKYHAAIYKNIDIGLNIGKEKPLSWCMRSCSVDLLNTFSIWIDEFRKTRLFQFLYRRYFLKPCQTTYLNADYLSIKNGNISPYDKIIQKYSNEIGWDWLLIASLIYEESKFQTDLVSYSGSFGIMQLAPVTAEYFGITPESSVEEQIRAGIKYIQFIDNNFKDLVPDKYERQKFVIAAYNLGEGHVLDAIALAKKYRKNPQLWDNNVEYFIIAKSQKKYFQDEVVQHGYCKGQITSRFVKNIFERYEHFKNAFSGKTF